MKGKIIGVLAIALAACAGIAISLLHRKQQL